MWKVRLKGYDGVCYHSSLTQRYNYTLFCGRERTGSFYSSFYGVDPLVPDFMEWLELIQYEYVKAQ